MTTQNKTKTSIENFEDLKNQKIEIKNSLKEIILEVFETYENTFFKQSDFAKKLNKRTQHVNSVLRSLLEENKIERSGSNRQYFYKLKK